MTHVWQARAVRIGARCRPKARALIAFDDRLSGLKERSSGTNDGKRGMNRDFCQGGRRMRTRVACLRSPRSGGAAHRTRARLCALQRVRSDCAGRGAHVRAARLARCALWQHGRSPVQKRRSSPLPLSPYYFVRSCTCFGTLDEIVWMSSSGSSCDLSR